MTDPVISRFAKACGAVAPLDLRVVLPESKRRVEGTVPMPFTLVGRDDGCDVTLTDPEVNPRHAWLQVIGGRVLVVDLGSRTGLSWPGQGTGSGWLDVGVPVRIGPFQLWLRSPASAQPVHFPPRYSPLQSDQTLLHSETTYSLEFRNGKRAKDRWTVNRLVTIVGRAPECKIRLNADDIAAYHCGLVLTSSGIWVVDLSGRGVVVNGERMRVSALPHGAELWVGRFLIGLQIRTSATDHRSPATPRQTSGGTSSRSRSTAPSRREEPADDEVPLGIVPPSDPLAGLPSSHIMADAFQVFGAGPGGGVSNPILVSGSSSAPVALPQAPGPRSTPSTLPAGERPGSRRLPSPESSPGSSGLADPASAPVVALLLRELGDLHGQMLAQFERSLDLMVRLFAFLGPEQLPAMQQELARIQELNSELGHLQVELARRAAAGPPVPAPVPEPETASNTPPSPDSTALHEWVAERIGSLEKERQARWQSLVGMFSAGERKGKRDSN